MAFDRMTLDTPGTAIASATVGATAGTKLRRTFISSLPVIIS
jgi:hypothetical protein